MMEVADLSDYDFFSEREIARYNVTSPARHEEDRRSPFERDRSRIIHSAAFRSLQGKTQIFEPQAADFEETKDGKFLYIDDTGDDEMAWLFEGLNRQLLVRSDPRPPRTLPCQLMDWADDIAYSVHDLEDGIASDLLRPSTWRSEHFMETIYGSVRDAPNVWVDEEPPREEDVADVLGGLIDDLAGWEPEIPLDVIREVSRAFINEFVVAGEVIQEGSGESLFDFKLRIPRRTRIRNQVLKAITIEYLLKSDITAGAFFKGHEILDRLFEALLSSCHAERPRDRYLLFPRRMRPQLREVADNQSDLRRQICDYLAGLTEGQVRKLYARFFEPGHSQLGP